MSKYVSGEDVLVALPGNYWVRGKIVDATPPMAQFPHVSIAAKDHPSGVCVERSFAVVRSLPVSMRLADVARASQ